MSLVRDVQHRGRARLSRVLLAMGVAPLLMLAGCASPPSGPTSNATSTPSATPTPAYTPGVDPDADVAAAIAAYEAYVEAENQVAIADRSTWDPLLDLIVGEMRDGTLETLMSMAEDGTTLTGGALILSAAVAGQDSERVVLDVCLDIGGTDIVGADGASLVSPTRLPISAMRVRVVPVVAAEVMWKIDYIIFREDGPEC